MCKKVVTVFLLFYFALGASHALAEGYGLYEYSARGVGLGGSMMARKPDASAVAYNPALLTRLSGTNTMVGVTSITPRGNMVWKENDYPDSTFKDKSSWFAPHAYFTHQLNDDWTFGIGEFTRFGLGFEYEHDWPGRFNIYQVALMSASVNPTIAWAATDKLSLAAGVEFTYVNLDIKRRQKVAALGNAEIDVDIQNADDVGVGFNLAAHYQFNDNWAVGFMYRSPIRVHAYGDAKFSFIDGPAGSEDGFNAYFPKESGANSTVILPDSISGGVCWSPVPEFSLEAGFIWTQWSYFRNLNIHMDTGTAYSKRHWKNSWRFNVGAEYDVLDWLTLRASYVYDQSPMTEAKSDYMVPTDGRHMYNLGVGARYDNWTFDLGYSYIAAKGRHYNADYDNGVYKSRTIGHTTLVSFSVGYKF